jgi:MarR family transcriptional regulator, transcriptional regulator for hemolysin
MPVKFVFNNLDKGAWVLLRQVYTLLMKCQDQVYGEYGLTTEQHTLLMAVRNLKGPARITDIARWLDRTSNSVSMLVDRMVKAGLVRRARDRKDRRTVFVSMTPKAEEAYTPATAAGWSLVRELLSPLSNEDKRTLMRLLGLVRDHTYDCLGASDAEEIRRGQADIAQFTEKMVKPKQGFRLETKRRGGGRTKAVRSPKA